MDDFLEGIFSEDSDVWDHGEAEAALYSVVHHSEETYNTSMLEFNGGYIQQRNNVNRWEFLKQIRDSGKPSNYIIRPQELSQAADHIPFVDNNISSISKSMYGRQFNKRELITNYHKNEKPRNMNERIRNIYQTKSNLVPIFVQRNDFNQQYTADPQAILKINNFSSFESPRNKIQFENLQNESNQGNVEPLKYRGKQSREGVVNSLSGMEQNKRNMSNRSNSNFGLKVAGDSGASTSKEENTKIIEVGSSNCSPERSSFLVNHNSKICTVESNITKVVEKSNVVTEVVVISDTDGNDDNSDQSVVEVCAPSKPSPPLIALDSSDESEIIGDSKKTLILNVSKTNNKLITKNLHTSQSTPVSSKNIKNPLHSINSTSKEIKKKKKKRKNINSFDCKSWTTGMMQFYNTSWGGETYDHQKLLQEMTPDPSKWKILDVDKFGPTKNYGPRIRCANCHQFGHLAKQCPDPKKIKCCAMCGQRGHVERQCPNKLCLKCGRPAPLFNEGCPSCWNHPPNCGSCGSKDHFKWLCPNVWRKLHSVTTTEDLEAGVLEETVYKSSMDQNCCVCARKGHVAAACFKKSKPTFSPRQSFSPKPPSLDLLTTFNLLTKKRKKKRNSYLEGKYNEQEFNRKRRKTN